MEEKIYYKIDNNRMIPNQSQSIIKIDCGTPIYIYTKIRYNWFRAMMYKICFGLEFKKIEENEKCC